jgi:hypothetical protein
MKALYDKLFTDYGGQIGYAPAIVTIAVCLGLCGAVIYGGFTIGKAAYAKTTAISVMHHA